MQILTPDGCREFRWQDPHQLPSEVVLGGVEPVRGPEPPASDAPPPATSPASDDGADGRNGDPG